MSATAVPIRPIKRGSVLKLWIALALLALAAAGLAWAGTSAHQVLSTASGLRYQVIEEGEGATITPADLVALHYELSLDDGTVVQSTEQTGQPFVTSTQGLFPGFSEGLQLMKPGGRYRLWIPPELGMPPPIPPGAPFDADDTLIFRIQILEVAPGMAAMQQMMQQAQPQGAPQGAPPAGGGGPAPQGQAAPPAQEGGGRGRGGR